MTQSCVVLAGGEGRRVIAATKGNVPKPMLDVAGIPFIHHKLNSLRSQGFSEVIVLTGFQASQLIEYLEDIKIAGLKIRILSDGPTLLGTGGGIRRHISELPEVFWVTYGDSITVSDISAGSPSVIEQDLGIMIVRNNESGHEPGNVALSNDLRWVTRYEKLQYPNSLPWIDYGLLRLSRTHFSTLPADVFDLSLVLSQLINARTLRALITDKSYFDIGTIDSYNHTCRLAELSESPEWWLTK